MMLQRERRLRKNNTERILIKSIITTRNKNLNKKRNPTCVTKCLNNSPPNYFYGRVN